MKMKLFRKIDLNDRLELYHIMAYFGVKEKRARFWRKEIRECRDRKSRVLKVRDLAEFEYYDLSKEKDREEFLDFLNKRFDIQEK